MGFFYPVLASVLMISSLANAEIYRSYDKDGNVVFSDKPTADHTEVTEIKADVTNVVSSKYDTDFLKAYAKREEERAQAEEDGIEDEEKSDSQNRELKDLKRARNALVDGRKLRDGDLIKRPSGGTLHTEAYNERVKRLEDDLAEALSAFEANQAKGDD